MRKLPCLFILQLEIPWKSSVNQQLVTKTLSIDENKTGEQQPPRTAHTSIILERYTLVPDQWIIVIACCEKTCTDPTVMAFIVFVLIYIVVLLQLQ